MQNIIRRAWQDYIINWASLTGVFFFLSACEPAVIREGWHATRGLHLDSKTRRLWLCTGPEAPLLFFTLSFSGLLAKKSEWQHDMNALSASGGSRSVYSNLKGEGFSTPADCENCYYLSQRRSAFTCVQSFVCLCVCWLVCERDCTYWFPQNLDGGWVSA